MADLDREVAGLRCRDVLERLSDFLDGELDATAVARVQAHLRGCDRCERFGGQIGTQVADLRRELAAPPPLDMDLAGRLRDRLAAEP